MVQLFDGTANVNVATSYPANVWHNVKISRNAKDHLLYLNGELLHTMPNYGTGSACKFIGIRYNNYGSGFSVDNLKVTNPLSTQSNALANFNHAYNTQTKTLLVNANESLTNIELFNTLGQKVFASSLNSNNASIDLSSLTDGVYIANVKTANASESFKLIKNKNFKFFMFKTTQSGGFFLLMFF